jgi:hypothetical protein
VAAVPSRPNWTPPPTIPIKKKINGELPVRHPVSLPMNNTIQVVAHNTAIFWWKMNREISNRTFFFITITHVPT